MKEWILADIIALPDTECQCDKCKSFCRRPCWPLPQEAQAIIDAGYGRRLMIDRWSADSKHKEDIFILCPANPGYEGKTAPFNPMQGCTFYDDSGLCELHNAKLKPIEGRKSHHKNNSPRETHVLIVETWDEDNAKDLIKTWQNIVGLDEILEYHPLDVLFGSLELLKEF